MPDPNGKGSVYAEWRKASNVADGAEPQMGDPGGGSDFAGFYNHLGIPIAEWGFGGAGGVYHSQYDDLNWMQKFGDPGYKYHAASASVAAAMVLRVANADVLRSMYHHYFGPDYYSFNRGGVHFIGPNSVDISGTSYYGHVDSVQLAWLARDLAHVSPNTPVVTFEHIPMLSAMNEFDGYDDGPRAPTLITVNGKTSFRHMVSNAGDVLAVLRTRKHVLAIGAHSHVGERVALFDN